MIDAGDVILDRYRVEGLLGEGGMGQVYRGVHQMLEMPVAIKVLHDDTDQGLAQRFLREAQTMARVRHPNVVQIFDCAMLDGWQPCIVMELLEGEALDAVLRREHAMDWLQALDIASDVCAGLEAIHDAGILHRDLKPANIMVSRARGAHSAKIVDFGIAKPTAPEQPRLTATGVAIGTPAYMAPEQIVGGEVTPAADLYALGATLYEVLTGELPFEGAGMAALLRKVQEPAPRVRPPSGRAPIPRQLQGLVASLLETEAAKRPASVLEVRAVLRGVSRSTPRSLGVRVAGVPASRPIERWRPAPPTRSGDRLAGTQPTMPQGIVQASAAPAPHQSGVFRPVLLAAKLPPSRLAQREEREWLAGLLGATGRGYVLGAGIWFARITRPDGPDHAQVVQDGLLDRYGAGVRVAFVEVDERFELSAAALTGAAELPRELQLLVSSL